MVTDTDAADTPLPAPTNLTAAVANDGSITLTWDAPNDASNIGYRIPRQRPTEGESNLLLRVGNTGTTTTTFTHTDVTEGIRHV